MKTLFEKLNERSNKLDRDKIIAALRQFDEGSVGDDFSKFSTEDLYRRLEDVADEKGYSAEDLIDAVEKGF
jgi:hypothetical protein